MQNKNFTFTTKTKTKKSSWVCRFNDYFMHKLLNNHWQNTQLLHFAITTKITTKKGCHSHYQRFALQKNSYLTVLSSLREMTTKAEMKVLGSLKTTGNPPQEKKEIREQNSNNIIFLGQLSSNWIPKPVTYMYMYMYNSKKKSNDKQTHKYSNRCWNSLNFGDLPWISHSHSTPPIETYVKVKCLFPCTLWILRNHHLRTS